MGEAEQVTCSPIPRMLGISPGGQIVEGEETSICCWLGVAVK